ncbi:MAG: MerR family transcriptional regulator [Rickettsiaceae bacterium]|nr:MerR family transcriptional regulator [Rickettsiaceae bacterium]
MLTKKYFSISEACNMCALAPHKLRYIDKSDEKISIIKIRGRRYYTKENIDYLIKIYSHLDKPNTGNIETNKQGAINNINSKMQINEQLLERIDQLIKSFHSLAKLLIAN